MQQAPRLHSIATLCGQRHVKLKKLFFVVNCCIAVQSSLISRLLSLTNFRGKLEKKEKPLWLDYQFSKWEPLLEILARGMARTNALLLPV